MNQRYTHFADLAQEAKPPADGILSRTLYNDDQVKVVIFGFAAGEELSEHTASMPAILQLIRGDAVVCLGEDEIDACPATWIHMPAGLQHSITAKTPVVLLLYLLKSAEPIG